MHPYLLSQVAHEHIADLRRSAANRTTANAVGRGRNIRSRAGWTLVQVGLRLAASSADA
jgi:hypothetical protein